MLGAISIGFLSAFALGPSGFNLFRIRVWKKRFPLKEVFGLLTAELVYLAIALWFLLMISSRIQSISVVLTLAAGIMLFLFSISGLNVKKDMNLSNGARIYEGFRKSFFLTISNPMVLALYLGMLSTVPVLNSRNVFTVISAYLISFLIPTLLMLQYLPVRNEKNSGIYKKIETLIYIVLLIYSIHLIWSVL